MVLCIAYRVIVIFLVFRIVLAVKHDFTMLYYVTTTRRSTCQLHSARAFTCQSRILRSLVYADRGLVQNDAPTWGNQADRQRQCEIGAEDADGNAIVTPSPSGYTRASIVSSPLPVPAL